MKRLASAMLVLLMVGMLASCATSTIRPEGTAKTSSDPTWSDTKDFFLWGLVNKHRVNTKRVCGDRGVKQVQAQTSFVNGLLTILTLGIYAPRTAKIWCN